MPSRSSPRIAHFQPDFGGADVGVEDRADIADAAAQHTLGIGIQMNLGVLADVDRGKIVFIHVADHPHRRQICDGEEIGRIVQRLDARRRRDILFGNHARNRRVECRSASWDGPDRRPALAGARWRFPQRPRLCRRRPAPLPRLSRDGAFVVEQLGALQLRAASVSDPPAPGDNRKTPARRRRFGSRTSSWPLVTVSPRRARTSTTRPEASEITGMLRDTSGLTAPVTCSSGAASRAPAVASGNCSG